MRFADITSRVNGTKILYSWFDALRDAGLRLETLLGGSDLITETAFTIANNQSSAANVTGLVFNHGSVGAAFIDYWIKRVTTSSGAVERTEAGRLLVSWDLSAATWRIVPVGSGPDESGVSFSITSAGQVQYTSDSITGTPSVSKMKFRATTMGV